MHISEGKIIRYRQKNFSSIHRCWGTFEHKLIFPNELPLQIKNELQGKKVGDVIKIPYKYNPNNYDPALLIHIPIKNLNSSLPLKQGMVFSTELNHQKITGTLKEINKDIAILDCNFPKVEGSNLILQITILEVRTPSNSDLENFSKPKVKLA